MNFEDAKQKAIKYIGISKKTIAKVNKITPDEWQSKPYSNWH